MFGLLDNAHQKALKKQRAWLNMCIGHDKLIGIFDTYAFFILIFLHGPTLERYSRDVELSGNLYTYFFQFFWTKSHKAAHPTKNKKSQICFRLFVFCH